jgi:hypothetical protein
MVEFVFPISLWLGAQEDLAIAEAKNLTGVGADTEYVALYPIEANKVTLHAFPS